MYSKSWGVLIYSSPETLRPSAQGCPLKVVLLPSYTCCLWARSLLKMRICSWLNKAQRKKVTFYNKKYSFHCLVSWALIFIFTYCVAFTNVQICWRCSNTMKDFLFYETHFKCFLRRADIITSVSAHSFECLWCKLKTSRALVWSKTTEAAGWF